MDDDDEILSNVNTNLLPLSQEGSLMEDNTVETKELANQNIAQCYSVPETVSKVNDSLQPRGKQRIVREKDKGVIDEAILTSEHKMVESIDGLHGLPALLDAQSPIAEKNHVAEAEADAVVVVEEVGYQMAPARFEAEVQLEEDKEGLVGEVALRAEPEVEASTEDVGGLNALPPGDNSGDAENNGEEAALDQRGNHIACTPSEDELDSIGKNDEDVAPVGQKESPQFEHGSPVVAHEVEADIDGIGKNGEDDDAPVRDDDSSANAKFVLQMEAGFEESSFAVLHDLQVSVAEKVVVAEEELPLGDSKMDVQSESQLPVAEEESPSVGTHMDMQAVEEVAGDDGTVKCGLEPVEGAEIVSDQVAVREQVTEMVMETEVDNGGKFVGESEHCDAKLFENSKDDREVGEDNTTAEIDVVMKVEPEFLVEMAKDGGEPASVLNEPQLPSAESQIISNQDEDNEMKQAADKISMEVAQVEMDIDTKTEMELAMVTDLANSALPGAELLIVSKNDEEQEMSTQLSEDIMITDVRVDMEMETDKEVDSDIEAVSAQLGGTEPVGDLDFSQVVAEDEGDEATGAEEKTPTAEAEMELDPDVVEAVKLTGGKRKRGKNSKVSPNSRVPVRASSRRTIEEDVCFICFDGGDLVLCDRRGCPKAYHPSCVNRDEAFFRAKGRWNCGWHLCSICEKNAHYMCYTCTFSLCKGCIKDAIILCVRENKGFCETCMRTVMLIESNQQGDKEAQVDFDDKSSWEYLFKDYYIELKNKLSLSLDKLSQARNPWKGSDATAGKEGSPEAEFDANNDRGSNSDNSAENLETSKPKRRKPTKHSKSLIKESDSTNYVISEPGNTDWASKELLEFVMHMKNGDKSVTSQFDVQALLLEYIKSNKLRDPRRKSQIICDSRLESLFGKPRVGHFEMLKLLESHFHMKEHSQADDNQGSVVDNEVSQLEGDGNLDALVKGSRDKKRKVRKKGDCRGPQLNLDDYAAIDMHNINLIFLRRKWMEDLLEDLEKFHDKIVRSFVRIRISSNNQKQDFYRLVYVVGTSRAAEPYRIGKRTCDVVLEILNLNKTEIISIDTISNQEFNEEECKRLRQSIKCGLINRLTVGDILDKAMELQPVRVDDWLETEIVRLSHLRDRASDTGRRKDLRECVEKLQLLKSPEERQHRVEAIPEIHTDPKMAPNHESENDSDMDENRREAYLKPRGSGLGRRGMEPISPGRGEFSSKDFVSGIRKNSSNNWELNRSLSDKNSSRGDDASPVSEMFNGNSWNQGRDRDAQQNDLEKLSSTAKSEFTGCNNHSDVRSASERLPASLLSEVTQSSPKINESEKLWHYKDPSGQVQGPFSMVQLRKWSNTGYFPVDLRIWRAADKPDDSILLTDALAGRLHKVFLAMDGKSAEAGALQSPHVLPTHAGKFSEMQVSNSSGGWMTPSVKVPKVSSRWGEQDSSNRPSPTPEPTTAVRDRGEAVMGVNFYSGNGLQSAAASTSGQLVRGSESDYLGSWTDFSTAPTSEQGILAISANSLQTTPSVVASESRSLQKSTHLVVAPDTVAHSVQSLNNMNPHAETHGWGSASSQNVEVTSTMPASGQSTTYGHWVGASSTVQSPSGTFSTLCQSALPQPDFWRPPIPGNQSNVQPLAANNLPWGAGTAEITPTAQGSRPDNQNSRWGTMQGNPNMGWGQVPGAKNMAWGATVQELSPGNVNPGWLDPTVNPTVVQAPAAPGNVNPGWVAPTANHGPGVRGLGPGNANSGWGTPAVNMGAIVPGQPGAIVNPAWGGQPSGNQAGNIQGPAPGNSNPGFTTSANQGMWGNDQQRNKDTRFSGQRDWGSHGGDSGYVGGKSWNRQSSFSNGRHEGSPIIPKSRRVCPYYVHGHCKKGASCDYLHS